jgi:hypothetical protein
MKKGRLRKKVGKLAERAEGVVGFLTDPLGTIAAWKEPKRDRRNGL